MIILDWIWFVVWVLVVLMLIIICLVGCCVVLLLCGWVFSFVACNFVVSCGVVYLPGFG